MDRIVLKAGRDKSLRRRHPWIFSGAMARVEGSPEPGDTVAVTDSGGRLLAQAAYSPHSQIVGRVWSFDADVKVGHSFFQERLERALRRRPWLADPKEGEAGRLINAESDGLPGVTVDRYGPWLVAQFTTVGADRWKGVIADLLLSITGCRGILERSDGESRTQEGLSEVVAPLGGETLPQRLEIHEEGLRFWVEPWIGHKTGFYLDQRENRPLAGQGVNGKRVLNAFCFSGAFGLHASAGGAAMVTQLDSSASALDLVHQNAALNGIPPDRYETIRGNAFQVMRGWREEGRIFDHIILDPPRLADSRAGLNRAARAYKDINWLAFRLLAPGGTLLTFSCSGRMPEDLFAKIVADAALDAGRDAVILRRLGQAPDHLLSLAFPEGRYLKGFLCQV